MILRLVTLSLFSIVLFNSPVTADDREAIIQDMQAALSRNDLPSALNYAVALYDNRIAQGDLSGAGGAAYSQASILEGSKDNLAAADAFERCEKHYREINAAAQALQCKYRSGLALIAGARPGNGLDTLRSTAKELESIGQGKSGLAALVYLSLAETILPSRFDRLKGATAERNASIAYAEKAMTALLAEDQGQSKLYASALLQKAIALEDLKETKQAISAYETFIRLYKTLPDAPAEDLHAAQIRLSNVRLRARDSNAKKTFSVPDSSGNEIVLKIKKKKRLIFPKINNNQRVDGAYATVEITLDQQGKVANLEILESHPTEAYGEALEKAVTHWTFTPPDGVSGLDIPAFEYMILFSVSRR